MPKKISYGEYRSLLSMFNYYQKNKGPWSEMAKKSPLRLGQLFCNRYLDPCEDEIPVSLFKETNVEEVKRVLLRDWVNPDKNFPIPVEVLKMILAGPEQGGRWTSDRGNTLSWQWGDGDGERVLEFEFNPED